VNALLDAVEIETGPSPRVAVIWMHGLGADGHDFEPIVPEIGLPEGLAARFVFPHAPMRPVAVQHEVGHHVLGDVGDALAGDERKRERRIHQDAAEFGLRRVRVVEMNRVHVLGQQREPAVVHGQDGPSERVHVDVTDLEIFVNPARPPFFDRHPFPCPRAEASAVRARVAYLVVDAAAAFSAARAPLRMFLIA